MKCPHTVDNGKGITWHCVASLPHTVTPDGRVQHLMHPQHEEQAS
jgi:hypothetical protein